MDETLERFYPPCKKHNLVGTTTSKLIVDAEVFATLEGALAPALEGIWDWRPVTHVLASPA